MITATARPSQDQGGVTWEERGSRSACNRRTEGHWFEDTKITKLKQGERQIDYCMYFLPVKFFKDGILKETNKEMLSRRCGEITWGEFMQFIGLWLFMSTVAIGCDRSSYWDSSLLRMWKGVPF